MVKGGQASPSLNFKHTKQKALLLQGFLREEEKKEGIWDYLLYDGISLR